jgi:hypothetical protein
MDIIIDSTIYFREPLFFTEFSGTQFSMTVVESMQSVFLKLDEFSKPAYPESRYLSSNEEVVEFFGIHLNANVFNLENAPLVLDMLRGRRRTTAQVIAAIVDYVSSHPLDRNYETILVTQTDKIYEEMVTLITEKLVYGCMSDKSNICFILNVIGLTKILKTIITLAANSAEFTIYTRVNLTDLGLVQVAAPQLTKKTVFIPNTRTEVSSQHLNERMVLDSCIRAGKQLDISLHEKIIDKCMEAIRDNINGTGKGKPFEKACICYLSETANYNNMPLSEVPIFKNAKQLAGDNFLHKVKWNMRNYGTTESLLSRNFDEYLKNVAAAKKEKNRAMMRTLCDLFIRPPDEFHIDAIVFHMVELSPEEEEADNKQSNFDEKKEIELYLQGWLFKLMQTVDMRASLLSTSLNKCYILNYKKDRDNYLDDKRSQEYREVMLSEEERVINGYVRVLVHATYNTTNAEFEDTVCIRNAAIPKDLMTVTISPEDLRCVLDDSSVKVVRDAVVSAEHYRRLKLAKKSEKAKLKKVPTIDMASEAYKKNREELSRIAKNVDPILEDDEESDEMDLANKSSKTVKPPLKRRKTTVDAHQDVAFLESDEEDKPRKKKKPQPKREANTGIKCH